MIIVILQARMSSSRLPGKVMKPLLGLPMLVRQIERIKRAKMIDEIVVATSIDHSDDVIEECCSLNHVQCFRGDLTDVLDRYFQVANKFQPEHVVRLTGDCPLLDPSLVDQIISIHVKEKNDYTSNTLIPTFPDGLDIEVIRFSKLKECWIEAKLPSHREHVTLFVKDHPERFKLRNVENDIDFSHLRWTVDEQLDFDLIHEIYSQLYPTSKDFTTTDILTFLENNPSLKTYNTKYLRDEGLLKSRNEDVQLLQQINKEENY